MAALGITPSEVYGALQQNNVLAAVGGTKGSNVALDLKAATDLNTTEEFERLIIRSEDNAIVRLEDFQRRVSLYVLPVVVQRGGANALHLTAGQRRLQDVGGIHRSLRRTCSHHGVHLIYEQDAVP